jgi:hypothetical protein
MDTTADFASLAGAELDLATKAIARARCCPDEFELQERRKPVPSPTGVFLYKVIDVTRVTTGRRRQYHNGRGGGWPFEFERDLLRGFFGQP